jgi:peptidoglycan hydrolase FlgJ
VIKQVSSSPISRIGGNGTVSRDTPSAGHDAVQREHDKQFASKPPRQLNGARQARNAKVDEVAKLYERQFLGEMFKAMRSTIKETDAPSMAQNIYNDQLDSEYVDKWSEQGGIGLSTVIYDQIMERYFGQSPQGQALKKQGPVALTDRDVLKVEKMSGGTAQTIATMEKNPSAQTKAQIEAAQAKPVAASEQPKVASNSESSSLPQLSKRETSSILDSQTALKLEVRPSPTGAPAKIQAPWDATVVRTAQIDGARKVVTLEHGPGLRSTLVFEGAMNTDIKQGEKIGKGQTVGTLSADAKSFLWNLAPQNQISEPLALEPDVE